MGSNCYNGLLNVGSFLSQIYTFSPLSNTITTLNLKSASYAEYGPSWCSGASPVTQLTMSYVAAGTSVSHSITYNVVPSYTY
jgi:hypothetical protein